MKLQYLGTAAAEGVPALFCDCENCRRSRRLGGRNLRTRSQALVDDRILIDFPADTYAHFLRYDVPMSDLHTCLVTHSHSDHLYPADVAMRMDGFAHLHRRQPLTFYADESSYQMLRREIEENRIDPADVDAVRIAPFVPFQVEGYTVTPIRASHDPKSSPVLFVVEKDGNSLFYANDSSEYVLESMECLKAIGHSLDVISLDCTEACNETTYVGHLCLSRCAALRETLLREGIADSRTVFVLNHFSHNGKQVVYDDFVEIARRQDFLVSYDGMTLTF